MIVSDIKNFGLRGSKILRLNLLTEKKQLSRRFAICGSLIFFGTGLADKLSANYLRLGLKKIFIFNFIVFLVLAGAKGFVSAPSLENSGFVAAAQENQSNLENERAELEAQLQELEKQIKEYEGEISAAKKQSKTLQSEIKTLENKIAKTNLQIKATEISLKRVSSELRGVEKSLNATAVEIANQKNILAGGLQMLYEEGETSLFEMLLENNRLSDFFIQINSFINLQQVNKETLDKIIELKESYDQKKEELIIKRRDTVSLKNIQDIQKQELSETQNKKSVILKATQGSEVRYRQLLKKSQETAAQIRSRIYDLLGIGKPITFGDAVKMANQASEKTGVRPAFLLAIISQESELGRNVGTCNRLGDPPEKHWTKVMKPTRDQEPFKRIIADLNAAGIKMDIDATPVSCPMRDKKGNSIGWGGAMGPAQFIPSTWVLFEDSLKKATGHSVVSPWNVLDAFMAAALYLKDLGATDGKSDSEWKAAMKYFSGSVNLRYRFYGDSVVAKAADYEDDIKAIGN